MKNINEQIEEILKEVYMEGVNTGQVAMGVIDYSDSVKELSTLIQKEREEAYIEGRKAISKYFQEGHGYTVWLEGSNLMIADESKMTLTKELFDETLSQTKWGKE